MEDAAARQTELAAQLLAFMFPLAALYLVRYNPYFTGRIA